MNHQYSTIALMTFISIAGIAILAGAVDTGIWTDEEVDDTITETNTSKNVCIGDTCYTAYQFSVSDNGTIGGSPICTSANGFCGSPESGLGTMDTTTIDSTNLSGTNGDTNRIANITGIVVAIDNNMLHPTTDYTNTSTQTTFLNPVWDDQKITFWQSDESYQATSYTGSDATGTNGATNRALTAGGAPILVLVDNQLLHPATDYTNSGNVITFINPLWDSQTITVWY